MLLSNAPTKVTVPFANSGTKNTIPTASQIGVTAGAASYTDGFPPLTFTPLSAGGVPPAGADFNGILNAISQAVRWQMAGGSYQYDSTFSTAVSGYPKGALLLNSGATGFFLNTVDANTTNPESSGTGWVTLGAGHGQCRLSVASGTSLKLSPYGGNSVIVNGLPLQLPAAGVTAANTGLVAATLYYVYLSGTTAAPVLALSTTTHVTGANGVEVKSGDATQTLVGMIKTDGNTPGQFIDSVLFRYCANWFNRRNVAALAANSSFGFTNTTPANIALGVQLGWLCWADEATYICADGGVSNNTAAAISTVATYVDSVAVGPAQGVTSATAGAQGTYASSSTQVFSEGAHITMLYGSVSSGSASISTQTNTLVRI